MEKYKEKIKRWLKTAIEFILNPRLLLCFGIAWFITNGWSYIALALGLWLNIGWLAAIGGGYLALLWVPFTPEKIITVIISIFLLRLLFPNDKKTLEKLYIMKEKVVAEVKKIGSKRKSKKQQSEKEEQLNEDEKATDKAKKPRQ